MKAKRRVPAWVLAGGSLAAAAIPFFGMLTAYAIAPSRIEKIQEAQPLVLPEMAETLSEEPSLFWREEVVKSGDTVAGVLARLGVEDEKALRFLRAVPETKGIFHFKAGEILRVQTDSSGLLHTLVYHSGKGRALEIERRGEDFFAQEGPVVVEERVLRQAGVIRSSLFGATDALGIPYAIALKMVDLFDTDIDFHQDLQKGDRFAVIYDAQYADGALFRPGKIRAAFFTNRGKTYKIVAYTDERGETRYYNPDGKIAKKGFLRSPLEFTRITSTFSRSRLHPIFKTWRAHKGVDYGAPSGARVKAVADGTVAFAGRQGGYGNIVVIRHDERLSTAYAHLRGFAPGIREGAKVSQEDIIGYVGATGWATGPHLHYELRVNGEQVNPLQANLPLAQALSASEMRRFQESTSPLVAELSGLTHLLAAQVAIKEGD